MKITHHYKSIISALAALALFYSAAPRAGILDGGEIQFHGLVTDEAPKWTWQVGSPDQTWAVDTADARTESGQLVFDLRGKGSLPFLEGHLYEVAERGGPGFTPFITFSSNGQPFSVTAGGSTTAQHFRASVPVNGWFANRGNRRHSPRPVAPTQLHFLSFAVASLREDFHLQ